MSWGRVLGSAVALSAVGGGVVVAVAMGHTPAGPKQKDAAVTARRHIPATKTFGDDPAPIAAAAPASLVPSTSAPAAVARTSAPAAVASTAPVAPVTHAVAPAVVHTAAPPAATSAAPATHAPTTPAAPTRSTAPAQPARTAQPAQPVVRGSALPLRFTTGNATRVITVTSHSAGSTTATLQAWNKVGTNRWVRYGSPTTAWIGADGMSTHASESRSATPIGSFTLTQAFGRYSNPGTGLPYFQTTPSDYWISDEGKYYNTHQRCSSCGYDDGVNERLYYETPYYNYAAVIDYNTRNAPGGVKAGRGSAFFLHVHPSGTGATAGCVSISQTRLVPIMRWLQPSAHPRILIGTV